MTTEAIKQRLLELSEGPNMNVEGVTYLSFLRKQPMIDFSDIPGEDYAITVSSLERFRMIQSLDCIEFRKVRAKGMVTYTEVLEDVSYYNLFSSSRMKIDDVEKTLAMCLSEKRLIPMFLKVK